MTDLPRDAGLPPEMPRPTVVVFDVNETLSDLGPMAATFEEVGAPRHLARTWFAGVLRDGFALTAVDASEPFARIAAQLLRSELHGLPLATSLEEAVEHVMAGFMELGVHPDVTDGVGRLSDLGVRLVTLSNGAASVAEGLVNRAGLGERFEQLLSVADAGVWKPAAGAYAYALERCAVDAAEAMLVAVHPWDIDGAARAGLRTAWVNRGGAPYPDHFRAPDLAVSSLTDLAERLR